MARKRVSKAEFRRVFVTPLEKEFGVKVYYNGEHNTCRIDCRKVLGTYYPKEHLIVIKFRHCAIRTLATLFHEIAHACLHRRRPAEHLFRMFYGEAESRYIERKVLETFHVAQPQIDTGSEYYLDNYADICLSQDRTIYPLRYKKMEEVVQRIVRVYEPVKEMINCNALCGAGCEAYRPETSGRTEAQQQSIDFADMTIDGVIKEEQGIAR